MLEVPDLGETVGQVVMAIDEDGTIWLEHAEFDDEFARSIDTVWITACGTAYHAGLVGREIFQRVLRLPTMVEYAHEMRYADPMVKPGDLTIAISQSGETADTLARKGIPCFCIEGAPADALPGFAAKNKIAVLVTDFDPLRLKVGWRRAVARAVVCRFLEV